MALKYRIKKLEDVAEPLRPLYRQEGDEFVLDAEGVVPKERLDEFRTNNIQLQQQLDKLKDVDPVKYRELVEIQRQMSEGELLKKGDLEGVVNSRVTSMKAALEGERDTFRTRAEQAESQLAVLLIDSAVRNEAIKHGVRPTALDDMVLRARTVYKMKDGAAVPHDDKGEVVYGRDGKTPMPMNDWVVGLKKTAPHLFEGSQGGGAGGGGRLGGVDMSKATPVQKIAAGLAAGSLMGNLPAESSNP
jgi:hypothetical protein